MNIVDFTYFKTLLYNWISDNISTDVTKVIWANQNAPAPGNLYVTLKISSRIARGRDYIGGSSDAGDAPIRGNREIMLSVQGFGVGAFQSLADLEEAFRFEADTSVDSLSWSGIVFVDTEGVIDITDVIGTRLEERAFMDVELRIGAPFEEIIADIHAGAIEDAEIAGTVNGLDVTVSVDT